MADSDRTSPSLAWTPARFVPLPENRSALVAVRRLARGLVRQPPRCSFGPLLLHGPPGTGKSHLADELLAWAAPRQNVHRCDAASWEANDELRRCDLLIVEDLQHLRAHAADDVAAAIDRRNARRQATLLTASKGPAELDHLPARLASRLTGGLVVGLLPLSVASRRTLLENRAAARGLAIRPEVLDWLAGHLPGSGRPLLAALDRLPPLATLDAVIGQYSTEAQQGRPSLERITKQVGRRFRVEPRAIRGRDRSPGVLWPRQVCMYLARDVGGLALARIGEYFGRDHSTVRHACQKVAESLELDAELAGVVRQLRAELMG